jgi:cell shape-determining protein MreC
MNLAGATAEAQGLAEHVERLHRENEELRKLLKIQDSGADGCDKI